MSDLKKEKNRSMKDLKAVSFYDFKNQEKSFFGVSNSWTDPKTEITDLDSFLILAFLAGETPSSPFTILRKTFLASSWNGFVWKVSYFKHIDR